MRDINRGRYPMTPIQKGKEKGGVMEAASNVCLTQRMHAIYIISPAAVRSPEDLDLLIFYGILHVYIKLALFS